jgi:hypothetical protein
MSPLRVLTFNEFATMAPNFCSCSVASIISQVYTYQIVLVFHGSNEMWIES